MQFNKISIQFKSDDYSKVAYLLPTPTYRRTLTQSNYQNYVIITYELKHSISSKKQFKWIANIKQSMKVNIKVRFEFIEYVAAANQDNTNIKYSLQELQEYFKPIETTYPIIYLPSNKKEIYQRLCLYASKLYYNKLFHLEMIVFASMQMNEILNKPYSYKELLSKSIKAYEFINSNKPKQKLSKDELKKALKTGGTKRAKQMKEQKEINQNKILELLKDEVFIKANGKPNISLIAEQLNLSRVTVTNLIKYLSLCIFPIFIFSFLISNSLIQFSN